MYRKSFCVDRTSHNFFGNRLGSIRDFQSEEWKAAYDGLEAYSDIYVDFILRHNLFPKNYRWPIDPLHNFTRIWEYPYVFHQLMQYVPVLSGQKPKVFDVGSALTFMPSFLASRGYDVTASDCDPVMEQTFALIQSCDGVPIGVTEVRYITCDCRRIGGEKTSWYDAVLCTSVLEHVPQRERALQEFHRILKPGGKLILTTDLNWNPSSSPLNPKEFYAFLAECDKCFNRIEPEIQVHPRDILRMSNHPRNLTARARHLRWTIVDRLPPFRTLVPRIVRKAKRWATGREKELDQWCVYGMILIQRECEFIEKKKDNIKPHSSHPKQQIQVPGSKIAD